MDRRQAQGGGQGYGSPGVDPGCDPGIHQQVGPPGAYPGKNEKGKGWCNNEL